MKAYEIIAVDDGSDRWHLRSSEPVAALRLRLSRSSGLNGISGKQRPLRPVWPMQAATSSCSWMATDKMTRPIFRHLLAKLEDGKDLVVGWRFNRQDPFLTRRLPSMIANRLISWTTKVKLHDYGCTLKAMRKDIAKGLRLYGEMHRFIPAIAYERGARDRRAQGQSSPSATRHVKIRHHPNFACRIGSADR